MPEIPNNNIIELLNAISQVHGDSLLEKIVSYCDKNNLDPQEVGDILADSEQFKRKLHIDLVHNHIIRDPGFSRKENLCQDLDEW